jgi:hypothetical protein
MEFFETSTCCSISDILYETDSDVSDDSIDNVNYSYDDFIFINNLKFVNENKNVSSIYNEAKTHRYEKTITINENNELKKIAIFMLNPSLFDNISNSEYNFVNNNIINFYGEQFINKISFFNMYSKIDENILNWQFYNNDDNDEKINLDYINIVLHNTIFDVIFVAYGHQFTSLHVNQWKDKFTIYTKLIKKYIFDHNIETKCFGNLNIFDEINNVFYPSYPEPKSINGQNEMKNYFYY